MQKLFAFHTAVGVILLTLFYSQTATMSTIFSTQPLTPHSMRLAGLIFLLITIINAFAAFDTVERLALKIFPTGTKTATAIAALANALFVVHYGFEAFYYRDVNMIVFVLLFTASLFNGLGIGVSINVSTAKKTE